MITSSPSYAAGPADVSFPLSRSHSSALELSGLAARAAAAARRVMRAEAIDSFDQDSLSELESRFQSAAEAVTRVPSSPPTSDVFALLDATIETFAAHGATSTMSSDAAAGALNDLAEKARIVRKNSDVGVAASLEAILSLLQNVISNDLGVTGDRKSVV